MAVFIAQPTPASVLPRSGASGRIAAACGDFAYGLVAVLLRLVAAHDFFLAGQANIVGPALPLRIGGASVSLLLPAGLRDEALRPFAGAFPDGSVAPALIAYGIAYAEFVLPICLMLGFGTRIAAALLLLVTAVLQIYMAPAALWTQHIYWASMLLVLVTCGGGSIALDALLRRLYRP